MNPGGTATKQMSDEFAAADATVNDQIDALMPQFAAANAKFVEDYSNARIIADSGGATWQYFSDSIRGWNYGELGWRRINTTPAQVKREVIKNEVPASRTGN